MGAKCVTKGLGSFRVPTRRYNVITEITRSSLILLRFLSSLQSLTLGLCKPSKEGVKSCFGRAELPSPPPCTAARRAARTCLPAEGAHREADSPTPTRNTRPHPPTALSLHFGGAARTRRVSMRQPLLPRVSPSGACRTEAPQSRTKRAHRRTGRRRRRLPRHPTPPGNLAQRRQNQPGRRAGGSQSLASLWLRWSFRRGTRFRHRNIRL